MVQQLTITGKVPRLAQKYSISIHDAAALVVREQKEIEEIYTFD